MVVLAAGRVRVPQPGPPQAGSTQVPRGSTQAGSTVAEGCSAAASCSPSPGDWALVRELLEGQSVGDTDGAAQARSGVWSGCYRPFQIWGK